MRDWLYNIRKQNLLTMKEVANALGMTEGYYCRIEHGDGKQNMDVKTASGIARLFHMSVEDVCRMEEQWRAEEE